MSREHYARIADLYDVFVRTDIDVPFFVGEARKAGGEVLELMAGTGRLTIPLLQAGIAVTAVDFSAEMLDRLREKLNQHALAADVREMDIRNLDLGRQYGQIIIPFQAFPELTDEADQLRALRRIHDHLADGGTFICTLHNPPVRLKSADGQLRLAGRFALDANDLFVWLLQRRDPSTNLVEVLEFFEEYNPQGVLGAKRFSEIRFHLLEKTAFEKLIEGAGFKVAALYGDYAYAPFDHETSPLMIWVLQKRMP